MENNYNTIEEALEALRAGKCILVIDDPDRENEGDLICAAQFATTENVNLMASIAKGLICMPMSKELCEKLDLPQMVMHNSDNHQTAFTVSVDHISTTTGISAVERGITARAIADPNSKPIDFRRHTEATVDLCRLAGLTEAGLCCEIMREDGTMMRTQELMELAKEHNIVCVTIKSLVEYRRRTEKLIECVTDAELPTKTRTCLVPSTLRMSHRRCLRFPAMRLRRAVG